MSRQYHAFLLRLRRDEGQSYWRATIENAHTGEVIQFANQQEMFRYLLQTLANSSERSGQEIKRDGRQGGDLSDPAQIE